MYVVMQQTTRITNFSHCFHRGLCFGLRRGGGAENAHQLGLRSLKTTRII